MINRINVTKTFLPPINEYEEYIEGIWERAHLTNQGPLLLEFEKEITQLLGVNNFHFVTNGTIALQVALRALNIESGDIITTPFSYVATTSSILWERCKPVFVDIEPDTFCIDADKIEASITPDTKAIMAVHVFGFPCNVDKIQEIANKYNLKIIYDAAHSFGVKYKGKSLMEFGDISVTSFHATKVFHTVEGGGIFVKDRDVNSRVELIKRFGHNGDDHITLGINAKASELQAAMGLCNLRYVDQNVKKRKQIFELYNSRLAEKYKVTKVSEDVEHNYAYYPFICSSEEKLLGLIKKLNESNIFPRRYFYPSLNKLPYIKSNETKCPISEEVAQSIMCLPLYADLSPEDAHRVCDIILAYESA